jgi:RHS repeat-associated protein
MPTVYHADGLGSVRALTDAAGAVVQTYETDEFGVPGLSQGTRGQPFGYTGEQRDGETGFVYLRARMYDPALGRFLQRDPFAGLMGAPLSLNRYGYVENNPVNLTDPSGLIAAGPLQVARPPSGSRVKGEG